MGRGCPIVIRTRMQVNPADAERSSHDLPGEISCPVRATRTTDLATGRHGAGEVSRGPRNSPVPTGGRLRGEVQPCLARATKGRTFPAKESVGDDSMDAERQQGKPYQRLLFPELEEGVRHDGRGEGRTGPASPEESQAPTASDPARALTER